MNILIIGAGAVGRGFVAPVLAEAGLGAAIDFADVDAGLLERMAGRSRYRTAFAGPEAYRFVEVPFRRALPARDLVDLGPYDAVFVSVGVGRYRELAARLRGAAPCFVLENTRDAAVRLAEAAGAGTFRFGIPDAIASNVAPPDLLDGDPLTVVAEPGALILEGSEAAPDLGPGVTWADAAALEAHWACKFFIHNTSHAIAAFLGRLAGHRFVHQAMADNRIGPIVSRGMEEVTAALVAFDMVDTGAAAAYRDREQQRFANPLLHDPIARVARDPRRKLAADDRLVLALQLVHRAGGDATPIMLGMNAALACAGADAAAAADILRGISGLTDRDLIGRVLAASAAAAVG